MNYKKNILIFSRYYLPGYRAGGPIRSIHNLVKNLEDDFNFRIVCLNKDHGVSDAYENIKPNTWNKIQNIDVFYMSSDQINLKIYKDIIDFSKPDLIYLNSYFDRCFSMIPLAFALALKIKVLLAPRGEFNEGALYQKSLRKKFYIFLTKLFRIYKNIFWHATSKFEMTSIEKKLGIESRKIFNVTNLPGIHNLIDPMFKKYKKNPGEIKILLLGRVSMVKNVITAIKIANRLNGEIVFEIIGVIDDLQYYEACLDEIKKSPPNVKIRFKGEIKHDDLIDHLHLYDILFLPTLGENFGHSIIECLSAGLPVVISDKTPWIFKSEDEISFAVKLDDSDAFIEVLQKFINMRTSEILVYKKNSLDFANYWQKSNLNIDNYSNMFNLKEVDNA